MYKLYIPTHPFLPVVCHQLSHVTVPYFSMRLKRLILTILFCCGCFFMKSENWGKYLSSGQGPQYSFHISFIDRKQRTKILKPLALSHRLNRTKTHYTFLTQTQIWSLKFKSISFLYSVFKKAKLAGCRLKIDNFNDLSFDQVPLLWK